LNNFKLPLIIAAAIMALAFVLNYSFPAVVWAQDEELERLEKNIKSGEEISNKVKNELKKQGVEVSENASVTDMMSQLAGKSASAEDSSQYSSGLYWFMIIFLSVTGGGYFWFGKRNNDFYFMLSGAAMAIYPYFVNGVWLTILIGVLLTAAPFFASYYSRAD